MAQSKETQLIIAKASHVLVAPRKTNLLLKSVVGLSANVALKELALIPKRASSPISKLIKQAVGNAVSLYQYSPDLLVIDRAFATKGRTIKRAHIGGRGRTKPYERISSHLTLYLRYNAPVITPPKETAPKEIKETKEKKSNTKSKTK